MALFDRIKAGLTKTRETFFNRIGSLLTGRRIDEDFFEELEEILLMADVGVNTTLLLIERLRQEVKHRKLDQSEQLRPVLREELSQLMKSEDQEMHFGRGALTVWMMVGVNGVGKTTMTGKLAHHYRKQGKKVLLAAGDTFRAGAIEQLKIWGERAGCPVVSHAPGADPAAVLFDAIAQAKADGTDLLICDTAGRLHNKADLMNELTKMHRVLTREIPDGPHEVLLVVDATTGQNAINQARIFKEATNVTGVVLTKLDGTAKGGVVVAIQHELGIPVKWVGLGEKITDLDEFHPDDFVQALFE
ncbi:MAG: signal recognition particle-docking protein FtsY [Bacilli bacterium]|nr:signal recognition particle-docking protein FtsY [Bacilli bacterium]